MVLKRDLDSKISNESLVAFLFAHRALRCVWCVIMESRDTSLATTRLPESLESAPPLISAYLLKWWRGTIEAEGPRCAFFCWFDLPRVAFVGVEGFCVTEGCSVSEPGLVGDTDKSNLTEIWYIWCSTYIYNIYIGSLIFQRRSFSRKWKRARREFGNVCFLFGSNDYGIPRFFAESLITDSCKCHARCLLRCDAKVAGQRKIRGVTI